MTFINKSTALFFALFSFLSFSNCSAEQLSYSDNVPLSVTNWDRTVIIPKFNPDLGTLISVQISFEGGVVGLTRFENTDAGPATITEQLSAIVTLKKPDLSTVLVTTPTFQLVSNVPAFDEKIDFAGPSGATHDPVNANDTEFKGPYSEDNAFFTGVDNIIFPVASEASSFVSGNGNLISEFDTNAYAIITVTYNYDAIPLCDPAVNDISYENLTCGGSTSVIQLDGSGSTDVDSESLGFLWSSNCPNGVFSDSSSSTPTLTFDSSQNGTPTICSVTLTVIDSFEQRVNCQVPVSVQSCFFDCEGTLNGPARPDACGVCEGNNSCFDCDDFTTNASSLVLDGNSIAQNLLVKKAVKLRRNITQNPSYGSDVIATANAFQILTWELAWGLPSVITTCNNAQLCQSVSNQAFESQYLSASNGLASLVKTVLTGLITSDTKQLKKIKQLKKAAKKLANENTVALAALPDQSQCVN